MRQDHRGAGVLTERSAAQRNKPVHGVITTKCASSHHRHTKGVEELRFDPGDCGDLRAGIAAIYRLDGAVRESGKALERLLARANVVDRAGAQRPSCLRRVVGRASVDADQAIGLRVRQRIEQYRLDDREHGRVDADAERQRDHRDKCKSSSVHELPESRLHVVSELVEVSGPHVVAGFLVAAHVAKALACGANGIGLAHSGAHVLASHGLDVKRHLLFHLRILRIPAKDGDDAAKKSRCTQLHVRLLAPAHEGPG